MAIQIPNPGTGNGASGDNEFVLWSKVKDNFTDQTNAASKIIGAGAGRIPLAQDIFRAAFSLSDGYISSPSSDIDTLQAGRVLVNGSVPKTPIMGDTHWYIETKSNLPYVEGTEIQQFAYGLKKPVYNARTRSAAGVWSEWAPLSTNPMTYAATTASGANVVVDSTGKLMRSTSITYTNTNTTKDSNGFIKAASPIVKVFADKAELNGEAEDQDVSYKKNGVGDYTITTASGLSTDGWYIELPKDMNGNPKVAVTLSEVDGVISLKTYKRIFSMETFTFEPDLDNPLDIPDTRWIDLRLNEIPVEHLDDIQTEV